MTYSTILVSLEAGRSNKHVLQAANDVADRFEASIIGSAACTPIQPVYADGYAYAEVFDQDNKEIQTELVQAEAEFRQAVGNARAHEWRSAITNASLADDLARQASRADLVLLASMSDGATNTARQVDVGDLIMQAGRPVLLVAPAPVPVRMDRVLIAWRDTAEARRAIANALPLLKRAKVVGLVEITDEDGLDAARSRLANVAAWLARHGVTAEVNAVRQSDSDAAGLTAAADELEADIVVAGAYGHSRVKEWAFGGVTRSLLRHGNRPSLVSH